MGKLSIPNDNTSTLKSPSGHYFRKVVLSSHHSSSFTPQLPPLTLKKYEIVFICSPLRNEFVVKLFKNEPLVPHSCQPQVRKHSVKAQTGVGEDNGALNTPGGLKSPGVRFGGRKCPVDCSHVYLAAIWDQLERAGRVLPNRPCLCQHLLFCFSLPFLLLPSTLPLF